MEKKYIIMFLNEKKRGIYSLLVKTYSDLVDSMPITIALRVIQEELEKESGEKVNINYNSLARAVARSRRKSEFKPQAGMRRREFKDAHELRDNHMAPGKFKIDN